MKLSICIPSYNRAKHLDGLLAFVFAQLERHDLAHDVEILVSDNASPDNTQDVVGKYLARGLIYRRNESNIGPDANFLQLFEIAHGNYIWLPGDDDLFNEDTIPYVIGMIDLHRFDYLFLRASGKNAWKERGAVTVTPEQMLWKTTIFTSFMTSQVIRAALVKTRVAAARQYLGGFMAYYSIFLDALHASQVCLISEAREIFPANTENTGGYRFYQVWAVSAIKVLLESPFAQRRKLVRRFMWDMLLYLLLPISFRLRNQHQGFRFESENPEVAMRTYYSDPEFRRIWSPYFRWPKAPLWVLHNLVRVVGRMRRIAGAHIS
jgi:glycosyltransferase involved in cell wall biosynthesis